VIKVSVLVQNIAQLEGLVAQLTVLDLRLGGLTVVPDEDRPRPSPVRRQSTSPKRTKHSKRRSSKMQVKLAPLSRHVPPRAIEAQKALEKHFGKDDFQKGEATRVVQQALGLKGRATGLVARLMDAGGLVQV
jgi:hypothetical protein